MKHCLTFSLAAAGLVLGPISESFAQTADHWPAWRGPLHNGVAPGATPPVEWSEQQNIKWKARIPGFGTSTPVVWHDQVYVLTAIKTGRKAEGAAPQNPSGPGRGSPPSGEIHQFSVLSLNRADGKVRWQKVAAEEAPHEGHHPDHGYASASPVTDGSVLLAYFGSRGLHCYDLLGNLKWKKEFGKMRTRNSFGEGSSPALHGNTVVVVWDDETDNDFIVALDRMTGQELWRKARNEPTGWSTPFVIEHGGQTQVVVNATGKVRAYDLKNGEELWQAGGQTGNTIPTPVASPDTVYVTSGFRGSALHAIALGRRGDLTGTDAIRWSYNRNTPYVPSPLLIDGLLYTVTANNGVISCFDAQSGKPHFEAQRLEGVTGIYASPIAADGRVYVLGRNGLCVVLKQGPAFEILARNKVDDRADASLAAAGRELFLRGHEHLYCIAAEK
jgi:outer membrane protein assembly factor BamB